MAGRPTPESSEQPSHAAATQAALEQLRRHFVTGLSQRWLEIEATGPGTLREAALHRLAGAAGGFGFEALGEAARRAERDSADPAALRALEVQIQAALVTLR